MLKCDLSGKKRKNYQWKLHCDNSKSSNRERLSFSFQLLANEKDTGTNVSTCSTASRDTPGTSDPNFMPNVLDEMEDEIERKLEEKAQRTNLTVTNVKNMLKAIITNQSFMEMVDYSLQGSTGNPCFEPKFTRSRKKELMQEDPYPAVLEKKSDLVALIDEDLPEDSSDEEYQPQEDWTDEESRNCGFPASKRVALEEEVLNQSNITENDSNINNATENIGQRTRSKFSLSETPLEAIENAFIPPDITTDMYNTECDNKDWANFLKEFMEPLDASINENGDDENDPEYNVMVDEEREATDFEELRVDKAVKVTKRELNDLMSELFDVTPLVTADDEECTKFQFNEPELSSQNDEDTQKAENIQEGCTDPIQLCYTQVQYLLLEQQMRQHTQLTLQSFLLSYGNPHFDDSLGNSFKSILVELQNLSQHKAVSYFNPANLHSALELVNEWENVVKDPLKSEQIFKLWEEEYAKIELQRKRKLKYSPKLPEQIMILCSNSTAFVYPLLLPTQSFIPYETDKSDVMTDSEMQLLLMGLEHMKYLHQTCKFKLSYITKCISNTLMPVRSGPSIARIINRMNNADYSNPIKDYYKVKKSPGTTHYIIQFSPETSLKLCEQPLKLLPKVWAKFIYLYNQKRKQM